MLDKNLDPGVLTFLRSAVQNFSWAFRNFIGQDREWTPTAIPRTVTTSGNVNPLDDVVLVDASASAVTMTLETAVACDGRQHTFKKIDSSANAFILDGNSSETIDGTASFRFTVQHIGVSVKSDGLNWRTVAANGPLRIADLSADGAVSVSDQIAIYDVTERTVDKVTVTNLATAIASSLNVTSGTYTPTLTNRANLDGSSADQCQWARVGQMVTVSGRVLVDPTLTATTTALGISLPVASNLGASSDVGGAAFSSQVAGHGAAIDAETSADTARMVWVSSDINERPMSFVFMYEVI